MQQKWAFGISFLFRVECRNNPLNKLDPSTQLVHTSCNHLPKNPDLELKVRPQGVSQKSTGSYVCLRTSVVCTDPEHA